MLALALAVAGGASAAAVTYANDSLRTGWYPDQGSLTPQLVTGGSFGQLFSTQLTGQVYGQPLVSNDTAFVGTEANWIYGLNPRTGAIKWQRNVGTPWNAADLSCADITPTVGITGTPVIDPDTSTAYFFAKSYASGNSGPARWDAHAVDVTTGQERPGFPVQIAGTAQNNPLTTFDATHEHQRPGLLLMDGVVYAAFGGHCDRAPFQGWVVGVSTDGQVRSKWVALGGQNQAGAGIWHSGGGIVSDGPGRMIVATGNGGSPPVGTSGSTPPENLGQSVVRLQVQPGGSLQAADFFAPYDAAQLDTWDSDVGSGGPVGLPSQYFGTQAHPNLMIQYGKRGFLYVLDRNHLGGIGRGPQGGDDVLSVGGPYGGIWSRPAIWPGDGGYMYVPNSSGATDTEVLAGNLRVFRYGLTSDGMPTFTPAATSSDAFGYGSSSAVVTSNGTTSGSAVVWIVWAGSGGAGSHLRAYSAVPTNGRPVLLWSAPVGNSTKFTPPGIAGGRVYVGTRDGRLIGFGSPVDQPLTSSNVAFPDTTTGTSSQPQVAHLTATRALTV
ncbi:MAG: hypothetical protein QOF37_2429, partial [Thermoleophilaceae bacterium]|nr:hypothetical protein [Thermoleophilaceae bacterium]